MSIGAPVRFAAYIKIICIYQSYGRAQWVDGRTKLPWGMKTGIQEISTYQQVASNLPTPLILADNIQYNAQHKVTLPCYSDDCANNHGVLVWGSPGP